MHQDSTNGNYHNISDDFDEIEELIKITNLTIQETEHIKDSMTDILKIFESEKQLSKNRIADIKNSTEAIAAYKKNIR